MAGAPEDGNPGRELGDEARQRAEVRALASLLRGTGPQYPFPAEEIEELPSEPDAPTVVHDAAEPARPPQSELETRTKLRPPPSAVRRRRVGRLVVATLILLLIAVGAVAALGAWELGRSRARMGRLAEDLRRARAELGAIRDDLRDLRADFRALAEELPPDLPTLLAQVEPSVVAIKVRGRAAASGVAVEVPALPKGYRAAVLTRGWVARAANRGAAVVVIHDRRSFRARPGEIDRETGLALLFIKAKLPPPLRRASTDGNEERVGQFVAAIGFPGRQISATTGVLTDIRPYAVRTDAPLTAGSAGGPLVNRDGEVVGIVRRGPNGLVKAIPIDRACRALVRC